MVCGPQIRETNLKEQSKIVCSENGIESMSKKKIIFSIPGCFWLLQCYIMHIWDETYTFLKQKLVVNFDFKMLSFKTNSNTCGIYAWFAEHLKLYEIMNLEREKSPIQHLPESY